MRNLIFLLPVFLLISLSSCRKGCADPKATNYSFDAQRDDGSCQIGGCTDPNAMNYAPSAQENDGTCLYESTVVFMNRRVLAPNEYIEVYWDDFYIGSVNKLCSEEGLYCESDCLKVSISKLKPGTYKYSVVSIPSYENLMSGSLSLGATQCKVIPIR